MPTKHLLRPLLALTVGVLVLGIAACGGSDDASNTSSSTATETTTPTGPSSDEIKAYQAALNAVGCYTGAVDGVAGPATTAGIKAFQQAEGLTADGVIGSQTTSALNAAAAESKTVCTSSGTDGTPGGGSVNLTSKSYSATFTVQTCKNAGETDLVLTAENTSSLQLSVNVTAGTGTLATSGGTEQDGILLTGNVKSLQVGDAGDISATGTFTGTNNAGEDFTLTGSCA